MEKPVFRLHFLAFLLIAALTVIIYSNSFYVPFHYDDYVVITENPNIKNIKNISDVFLYNPSRPLSTLSFALNYYFNSLNPFGYHVVNLIFHIANGWLIFVLLFFIFNNSFNGQRAVLLTPFQIALFTSLIFCSHPIQTESVTYISSRIGIMCTTFYLISIIFFLKFLKSNKLRGFFYSISLISFLVALGFKEIAATLPVILMLFERFFLSSKSKKPGFPTKDGNKAFNLINFLKAKWYYLPFLFFIAVVLIMRYLFFGAMGHPKFHRNLYYHFLTQSHVIVDYIRLLFLPVNLTVDHGFSLYPTLFKLSTILCVSVVFLILIFSIKNIRKASMFSFSILLFFITLSPTSLIPLEDSMSERWLYLPLIGFCLLLVFICQFLCKTFIPQADINDDENPTSSPFFKRGLNKFPPVYFLSIIILLFSADTFLRNNVWKSEYTLWNDALAKTRNKARPYLALGCIYIRDGNYLKGIDYFEKSIRLYPTSEGYNNLAFALSNLKITNESNIIKILEEAIRLKPKDYKAYLNLGDLYFNKGDYSEAFKNYEKALEVNPKFGAAHWKIGLIYEKRGQTREALERYKKAVSFDPLDIEALYSLGTLYQNTGEYDNAIQTLKKVTELAPNHADVLYNLGLSYFNTGRYDKAAKAFQDSIKADPKKADVHNSLGVAFQSLGLINDAIVEYKRALQIDPKYAEAYGNLGIIYKLRGDKGNARTMFEEALKYDPSNKLTQENLKALIGKK